MPDSRRALVLGVNGQDGSYLAEQLLAEAWAVVGIGRQPASRYVAEQPGFTYRSLDLAEERSALPALLVETRPTHIYHFAAVHGPAGFSYESHWQSALAVNVGSVHHCLEYARNESPVRLLYASSAKAFGDPLPAVVSEATPLRSSCLYSITKNAAAELVAEYRKRHGVRASVAFFFNHDSPRRGRGYFLPRLVEHLARAMSGQGTPTPLRSLDFVIDLGSGAEYVELARRVLDLDANEDYVIAAGHTWTGVDLVDAIFRRAGLDWRGHLRLEQPPGTSAAAMVHADNSGLVAALGHGPRVTAVDVAFWILKENHGLVVPRDLRVTS